MPRITTPIYDAIVRRNPIFLASIFLGAFAFEIGFDTSANKLWDTYNRGRQWKDIKHAYLNKDDEE